MTEEEEILELRRRLALAESERNIAIAAAHDREAQLRLVLKGVGDQFYLLDRDWRFVFASRSALEKWRKRQDEVIGQVFLEAFPEAEGSLAYEAHRRVMMTGTAERFETVSPVLNRWIEVEIAPTQHGGLSVAFRDIQDRKRAEAALRESEERLRNVLNSMAEGFALLGSDFTILDVNDETLKLDGRRRDELVGRSHWDAFPGTHTSKVGKLFEKVMRERAPGSLEHQYAWPDGRALWLDLRVYPTSGGIAIFWRDITDRKQTEAALRASEERYRTLFASMNEGYCIFEAVRDIAGNVIDIVPREMNQAWEEQTGIKGGLGRRLSEYFPDLENHWLSYCEEVTRTGIPIRQENYQQDIDRWWTAHYSRVGGPGSDLVAVVFDDITERKRAELVLRESGERHAFLLKLSDALRPLTNPADILREASRLLGENLRVGRIAYAEIGLDGNTMTVLPTWRLEGITPLEGRSLLLSDYGSGLAETLRAGRTHVVRDSQTDPEIEDHQRPAYAAVEIRATVGVPLVKNGKLLAILAAHDREPREWKPEEILLVEQVAERTWAAVERAHAEAALRKSEDNYRRLFETMRQGYVEIEVLRDAEGRPLDYVTLSANPQYERLTGIRAAASIGRPASEAVPGIDPFWLRTFDRVARTGHAAQFEHHEPALKRWFDVQTYILYRDRLAVLYDDITERKRVEAVLRESEERQAFLLTLSDALRAEPDAAEIGRLATRLVSEHLSVDRCYLARLSPAADRGWAEFEFRRPHLPSVMGEHRFRDLPGSMHRRESGPLSHSDVANDPMLSDSDKQSMLAMRMGAVIVAALRGGDREYIWTMVVATVEPRQWTRNELNLLQDAAERTWTAMERARSEAALRESEERFQQFAKASAAALWIRNANTLAMEFVSPAIAAIYGVPANALLGDVKHWASMIVPEDRNIALQHLEEARKGDAVVHEFRIQRPTDQAFRWIRNTDFPLHDDGHISRIGGIAEDITEAKLAVEHQGVLLAELQHRVRNIMAIIRSIAARSSHRAGSVQEYADVLAGRLMAFARVQALLTRAANLSVSLRSIVLDEVSVQAQHAEQYEVAGPQVEIAPKAAEVLTLAIHELTTNALKYGALSVPTGKVSVRWTVIEKYQAQWLSLDWTEHNAPEPPASDPAKPHRTGFGSELIEARIPYELNGLAKLVIEPGGARCHIEFPLRGGASVLETGAPQRATVFGGALDMTGEPDLSGRRILVVEDDYYLANDAARALRGAGADVMGPCSTEEQAREELARQRPDAVLLDINLGLGLTFKLAETLKDDGIPFAFVTGYDQDIIPAEFEDVERLEKPIQLRRIVSAIAKILTPTTPTDAP